MELHLATTIDRRSSVSSTVWSAAEAEAAAALRLASAASRQPAPTKRVSASTPVHSQPLSNKSRQATAAVAPLRAHPDSVRSGCHLAAQMMMRLPGNETQQDVTRLLQSFKVGRNYVSGTRNRERPVEPDSDPLLVKS